MPLRSALALSGPIYRTLERVLPGWALATLLVAAALWLGGRALARRGTVPGLLRPVAHRSEGLAFALFGAVLLALADGQGFLRGFFRYDDFAFVQNAREGLPFGRYLQLYHADHTLPLYRLEVWGVLRAVGERKDAAALAAAFNAAGALSFLALLLSGAWILIELGARRLCVALFMVFAWVWPGWGSFTSGFYTITVYPQTAALGFAAIACLLRFASAGRRRWAAASLLLAAVAAGCDVSGCWILPVLLAFAAAIAGGRPGPRLKFFAMGVAAVALAAGAYHFRLAIHPFSEIERVQNPGGVTLAGGSLGRNASLGWRLAPRLVSGLGGVLVSAFVPPYIGEIAVRVAASRALSGLFYAIEGAAAAAAVFLAWRAARRFARPDRLIAAALLSAPIVYAGMVIAARGYNQTGPGTFWPPKYQCVPYCCLALGAAFFIDRSLARVSASAALPGLVLAGGLALWQLAPQWGIEKSLAIKGPWHPGGRWKNVHDAEYRRRDFRAFQADVVELAQLTGKTQLAFPPVDLGWNTYPYLEIGYNIKSGSNYLCSDLMAAAPDTGIRTSTVPRAQVPAAVQAGIDRLPRLRALFRTQ